MDYELNSEEKTLVTWLVEANRSGKLDKRFRVLWMSGGGQITEGYEGSFEDVPQLLPSKLDALEDEGLLRCNRNVKTTTSTRGSKNNPKLVEKETETSRSCTITEEARQAVDNGFIKPEPEPASPSAMNQTNIINAEIVQSAFGPNSHVEISQSLDLNAVRRQIDEEGGEYRDDLHELVNLLEGATRDGEVLEQGTLARFNETMQNRAWIMSPVVTLLLSYAMGG